MQAFLEDCTVGMEGTGMQGLLEPWAANSGQDRCVGISQNAEQPWRSANSNTRRWTSREKLGS